MSSLLKGKLNHHVALKFKETQTNSKLQELSTNWTITEMKKEVFHFKLVLPTSINHETLLKFIC